MPTVPVNQLIGKTIKLQRPAKFYKVSDINKLGDKATAIKNLLPKGYSMHIDTFLAATPGYTNLYGIKYAARKDNYLTFFGADKAYYAIKEKDLFIGEQQRKEQEIKTTEEIKKEQEEADKTPIDKLFEGFGKFANFAKYLVIGITAVWATGYIIKQTRK